MNSTILVLALTSLTTGQTTETPHWQSDYAQARTEGENQKKPLAVFLGSGAQGWDRVARDGGVASQAQKTLADKFVCVYVDMSTESGKQLAQAFSINANSGLVVSDRSGEYIAFRQQGDMTNSDLQRQLDRLASMSRTSFYPNGTLLSSVTNGATTSSVLATSDCPTCGGSATVSTGGRRLLRR